MSHAGNEAPDFSAIALGASGDVAYAWDFDTDKVEFTGALANLGLTAATAPVSGRSLVQRINPEDVPSRQHRLSRHIHADEVFEAEYRFRADSGSQLWVQDRGRIERNAEGRAARMTGVLRSIGERKEQRERGSSGSPISTSSPAISTRRGCARRSSTCSPPAPRPSCRAPISSSASTSSRLVNNAFGYEAADAVMVEIGQRLDRCLRCQRRDRPPRRRPLRHRARPVPAGRDGRAPPSASSPRCARRRSDRRRPGSR